MMAKIHQEEEKNDATLEEHSSSSSSWLAASYLHFREGGINLAAIILEYDETNDRI